MVIKCLLDTRSRFLCRVTEYFTLENITFIHNFGIVVKISKRDRQGAPNVYFTVCITEAFNVCYYRYQTADVFKTLITKLAPEVFKCMYNGCIFAEDDPDTFTNHIREHGREYRCVT